MKCRPKPVIQRPRAAFTNGGLKTLSRQAARGGPMFRYSQIVMQTTAVRLSIRRLSSTCAIHPSREVVDTVYHAAGATAILESHPFERRFRDIHPVIQQHQGRQVHFESVGQVLPGLEPGSAMFTF